MSEEETVSDLAKKEAKAILCCHIIGMKEGVRGFNVPEDLHNDLQAWCDDCDAILVIDGKWTERALQFADFQLACVCCFIEIREQMACWKCLKEK